MTFPPGLWSPRALVIVGFVMLLLTSLQGWVMVGLIAGADESHAAILHELRRLHNLGLAGGFLALSFGLALILLPVGEGRTRIICKTLLPSLLLAPIGFSDRMAGLTLGPLPSAVQAMFYALQAASALGITVALALIVLWLIRDDAA